MVSLRIRKRLVPIAMSPLFGGAMTMKDRILEGFRCLKESHSTISREDLSRFQAILYVLATKFLNSDEMKEVKNMAQASLLGQLIWKDGVDEGRKEGKREMIEPLLVDWLKDGVSRERIQSKLINLFGLSEKEALEYCERI